MGRLLVGTPDNPEAEETICSARSLPPPPAPILNDTATDALDRYVEALEGTYPGSVLTWSAEELDTDVTVIQVFDQSTGTLYRSIQPINLSRSPMSAWEVLDQFSGLSVVWAPSLLSLALRCQLMAASVRPRPIPTQRPPAIAYCNA